MLRKHGARESKDSNIEDLLLPSRRVAPVWLQDGVLWHRQNARVNGDVPASFRFARAVARRWNAHGYCNPRAASDPKVSTECFSKVRVDAGEILEAVKSSHALLCYTDMTHSVVAFPETPCRGSSAV